MIGFSLPGGGSLVLELGDITRVRVDAIVNAANERMLGGGGVDGAIHRGAGPDLLEACRAVPEVRPGVRCPRGEARATAGFRLQCESIIHTVGPVFESDEASAPLLAASFRASLELAADLGHRSIAFPAISCGVYGYPVASAAEVALVACRDHSTGFDLVRFVLFDAPILDAFEAVADRLFERSGELESGGDAFHEEPS